MVLAIIQARMGSTRLPGKVLKEILGKPMLAYMIERVQRSKYIDKVVIATTLSANDDQLFSYCKTQNWNVFRGSENDVLDRYYQTALPEKADVVVRLTADCPLIDHRVVDDVVGNFLDNSFDYVSNINPPTYPDGLDTEVFSFVSLQKAWKQANEHYDREHVTPYIRRSEEFKRSNIRNAVDLSDERWTVDDPEDLTLVRTIFEALYPQNQDFSMADVLEYKNKNPEVFSINKKTKRNEGAGMSTGQKLWKRAKNVIAGGNSLLSKRPDMFLPDAWPSYFEKAKGIEVWDLDNNKYIDMSIMGIGTNVLGYANGEVDGKVKDAISKGTCSTLNCPEEVLLAGVDGGGARVSHQQRSP